VGNRSRGFVNSFLPDLGDRAVRRLVSPPFVLAGDLVTLRVGGGDHGARADLLVDGEPVRSASGCGSEILRREVWDVRAFRGRTASLQIVDERREPGGHILVDDVAVWEKRGPDTP
jgi:levanbiose-producing levanase